MRRGEKNTKQFSDVHGPLKLGGGISGNVGEGPSAPAADLGLSGKLWKEFLTLL